MNTWFYDFLDGEIGGLEKSSFDCISKEEITLFLKKHNIFFNKKFPLQTMGAIPVEKMQFENTLSNGSEIVGKIRFSDSGISIWVKPELVDNHVIICDLLTAQNKYQENIIDCLSKTSINRDNPITKITQALNPNGIFLQIPDNLEIKGTFVIEVAFSENNTLIPLNIVSLIGKSTSVNILINYSSIENDHRKLIIFSKTDFFLDQSASLHVFSNQHCNENTAIFIDEKIIQEKDSISEVFSLDTGAAVVERNVSIDLNGEGAESIITGVYKPEDGKKYYYDTEQNHKASNTTSDLQYKGVLGKEAFMSWKGNIVVEQKTIGTNGYQLNNSLILDESARIESVPGLEILTDDVRCSHGVTIGNIDKNHMFYLQSRGINETEAEKLIVDGFLTSAKRRVKNQGLLEIISRFL